MRSYHIAFLWGITFLTLTGVQAFLISKTGRCSCINVSEAKIQRRAIQNLEEIPPDSWCSRPEIIVTMKNGNKKCLDPDSPHVKMLVKMWKKKEGDKNNKPKTGNKRRQTKNAKKMKKAKHPPPRKTA